MRFAFFKKRIALLLALSLIVTAPVFAAEEMPEENLTSVQNYDEGGVDSDIDEYDEEVSDNADTEDIKEDEDKKEYEDKKDDEKVEDEDKAENEDIEDKDEAEDSGSEEGDEDKAVSSDLAAPRKLVFSRGNNLRNGRSSGSGTKVALKDTSGYDGNDVLIQWNEVSDTDTKGYVVEKAVSPGGAWVGCAQKQPGELSYSESVQLGTSVWFYRVKRLIQDGSSLKPDDDSASDVLAVGDPEWHETGYLDKNSLSINNNDRDFSEGNEYPAIVNKKPDDYNGYFTFYYWKVDEAESWTLKAPDAPGTYQVKIDASNYGHYKKTSGMTSEDWRYSVTTVDLANATVTVNGITYDGNTHGTGEIDDKLVVKIGSKTLVMGTDYSYSVTNDYNTDSYYRDAGKYKVTVDAMDGTYTGSQAIDFYIAKRELNAKPEDYNIDQDDVPPAASSINIEFTGNVEGEIPGQYGVLEHNCPSPATESGTYDITQGSWTIIDNGSFEADNYELNFTNGTITVNTQKYTVSFNANGGSWSDSSTKKTVNINKGDKIGSKKPADPSRDGKYFGGWYDNEYCTGSAFDFNSTINSGLDLYAKWNDKQILSSDNFSFSPGAREYNGAAQPVTDGEFTDLLTVPPNEYIHTGKFTYKYAKTPVLPGSLFSDEPKNAGTYQVSVDAAEYGIYGEAKGLTKDNWQFTIAQHTIADGEVYISDDLFIYDGTDKKPTVTVKIGNVTLPATDYSVEYPSDSVNIGTKIVRIVGKANCTGTVEKTYKIKKELTADMIELGGIPAGGYIYNGAAKEPTITVKDGSTTLNLGTDYTIEPYPYINNVNATTDSSKAYAVINAVDSSDYIGTASKEFAIGQLDINTFGESFKITPDPGPHYYAGYAVEPNVLVSINLIPVNTLSYNKTFENNDHAGTAKVKITGKGNFKGEKTATFEITNQSYRIHFDPNGGAFVSGGSDKTVNYSGTYGTLPGVTRTGYDPEGWFTAQTGGTKIEATTNININSGVVPQVDPVAGYATLYSHWTAKEYDVTLNANGGHFGDDTSETTKVIKAVYDAKYTNLPGVDGNPRKPGNVFMGWWTTLDETGELIYSDTDVTWAYNHTLYAHWEERPYEVTLDPNGGSCSINKIYVQYGNKYSEGKYKESGVDHPLGGDLPKATLTGYEFKGWWTTTDDSGEEITKNSDVGENADNQTLHAHWEAKTYTVTLDPGDGAVVGGKSPVKVTYDKKYGEGTYNDLPLDNSKLPDAEKAGYDFKGWWTAASGGTERKSTDTVKITADETLYAHWTAETYKVTFNAEGGSVSPTEKNITFDKAYGTLPTPKLTGYTFGGWYTGQGGAGSIVDSETVVNTTGDRTLYAKWTPVNVKVTLNENKGDPIAVTSFQADYDSSYYDSGLSAYMTSPPPANLKRTGYAFEAWYTEAEGGTKITQTTLVKKAADHYVYAHWTPNKYKVTLDLNDPGNGASCDKNEIEVTYDSTYSALPTPAYRYREYTFTGWFDVSAATGGNETKNSDKVVIIGPKTLYARWIKTVSVNGLTLDRSEAELKKGDSLLLNATVLPENATNRGVIWESSDPSVAAVNNGGLVIGIKPGNAVITASSQFDPSIKAECKISVVLGNEEEVVDTEGNKVIIVRDPKTNAYTTYDGLSVLVISRADGSVPDPAQYLFTSKKIRPGHKGFVLFQGVLYKSGRHCKIRYRKNKRAGTAKATVIWKKISRPFKNGVRRSNREFIILVRSVSSNNVVKMRKFKGRDKIIKVWLECDGEKIKTRKINFTAQYSGDTVTIKFRNSLEGTATISSNNMRRKLNMIYVDQSSVQNNNQGTDQQNQQKNL